MHNKKITLFEINENNNKEYQLSEIDIPNAKALASYDDLSEIYPSFYDTNISYDVSLFTSNSAVSSYYATTPTRTVSDAARARISLANSSHQKGEGNSQFGTRWIYSDELKQSKKIRSTDPIPEGWLPGRKIKFDGDNNDNRNNLCT